MIATEQGGRGANAHRGRSAFLDGQVETAMRQLLELGAVQPASRQCEIDGTRTHYLQTGEGPTLLLLHGAGGGAANWYRLMRPLGLNYRIVAPDLPGFGLSDAIEPRAPLGRHVARHISRMLAAEQLRPEYVIGTSFGALVAMRLADALPVRKVALIDPAGLWPDASIPLRLACLPAFQRLGLKQTRRGARWALRHILTSSRLAREHEAALAEYIFASAARTNLRMLARGYGLFGSWRGQSEVITAAELAALATRTLIIWGARDRFLPASQQRRASALAAGAQLRIIPGVGHSPNWESPGAVLELVFDFFSGSERGETGE